MPRRSIWRRLAPASSTTRCSRSAPISAWRRCSRRRELRLRVWERGAGITPACGTGACAALVAAASPRPRRAERGDHRSMAARSRSCWREDGHVLMTGPAAVSFAGTLRPRLLAELTAPCGLEIVTFGCRLNAFESEVIRRARGEAGLDQRRHRQHLRRDRRGRAPGAPGDPPRAARAARGAGHRHRLRRADRSRALRRDARSRPGARQPREAARRRAIGAAAPRSARAISARARRIWSTASRAVPAPFSQVQQGCDHRCTFCIIP